VAQHLTDLSADLGGVVERDSSFPLPFGRGGQFHQDSLGINPRRLPKGPNPRDIHSLCRSRHKGMYVDVGIIRAGVAKRAQSSVLSRFDRHSLA
jgi:hypothetical protein